MTYQIQITLEDGFLHAYVTGKESLENFKAYWQEISEICVKRKYQKVLLEDYLERAVPILDLYTFARTFVQETGIPFGTKIAMVMSAEQLDVMMFTESVINNWNGVSIKAFTSLTEARSWLL